MQEDCIVDGDTVVVPNTLPIGANIRAAGEDVAAGRVVLQRGDRIRPQDVGMAATVGLNRIKVLQRLRVAVFATGDELREPGAELPEGCIHDSNRFVSAALFSRLGFQVSNLGIVPDRFDAVRDALADAARTNDLIVTSGGVSEGDEDHVVPAVRSLGGLTSWKLAVKPGKPLAFGQIGDALFVGLPGNPVAAMVSLVMVARPLALRLAGVSDVAPQRFPVMATSSIRRNNVRRQFLRGRLMSGTDGLTVAQYHSDGSGILSSLTWADGLIDVPAGEGSIPAGHHVDFIPFAELLG
jgi:molybdopterin molybdotransferase